jgi:hypothetical protein
VVAKCKITLEQKPSADERSLLQDVTALIKERNCTNDNRNLRERPRQLAIYSMSTSSVGSPVSLTRHTRRKDMEEHTTYVGFKRPRFKLSVSLYTAPSDVSDVPGALPKPPSGGTSSSRPTLGVSAESSLYGFNWLKCTTIALVDVSFRPRITQFVSDSTRSTTYGPFHSAWNLAGTCESPGVLRSQTVSPAFRGAPKCFLS